MSGRQTLRALCAEVASGCREVAFYDQLTVRAQQDLARRFRRDPWRCTRHSKPDEVLGIENATRTVVLTAERSTRYPNLTDLFWREDGKADVGSGFAWGPGFKAWANDFPEGTHLVITAALAPADPDLEPPAPDERDQP